MHIKKASTLLVDYFHNITYLHKISSTYINAQIINKQQILKSRTGMTTIVRYKLFRHTKQLEATRKASSLSGPVLEKRFVQPKLKQYMPQRVREF